MLKHRATLFLHVGSQTGKLAVVQIWQKSSNTTWARSLQMFGNSDSPTIVQGSWQTYHINTTATRKNQQLPTTALISKCTVSFKARISGSESSRVACLNVPNSQLALLRSACTRTCINKMEVFDTPIKTEFCFEWECWVLYSNIQIKRKKKAVANNGQWPAEYSPQ